MNPMDIFAIRSEINKFQENHPKFIQFIKVMAGSGIQEGTIFECKVISPEGKEISTNIRVTQDDLELIDKLKEMSKK